MLFLKGAKVVQIDLLGSKQMSQVKNNRRQYRKQRSLALNSQEEKKRHILEDSTELPNRPEKKW